MADTLVDGDPETVGHAAGVPKGVHWINEQSGAALYLEQDATPYRLSARHTSDGGATWAQAILAPAYSWFFIDAWFDQDTPGLTGSKIHVVGYNYTVDAWQYVAWDLSTQSWGTPVTIRASSPDTMFNINLSNNRSSITRAKNGDLHVFFQHDDAANLPEATYHYRSVNGGSNWSSRTSTVYELTTTGIEKDWAFALPANTADAADIAVLYWDASAGALSVKMVDDSAETVTETSIAASGFTADSNQPQLHAAIRHSDERAIMVAANDRAVSGNDVQAWELNLNSIASPGVTGLTNVVTNDADSTLPRIHIDPETDDLRCAVADGTWASSQTVKFYVSTNGGTSWGTVQDYSESAATVIDGLSLGSGGQGNGARFQPIWQDGAPALRVNLVNDVPIPMAGATSAVTLPKMTSSASGSADTEGDSAATLPSMTTAATGGSGDIAPIIETVRTDEYLIPHRDAAFTVGDIVMHLYTDQGDDLRMSYAPDHWATPVETEIFTGSVKSFSGYWRQMTPGITSSIVDVVFIDDASNSLKYCQIDLDDGTHTTPITITTFVGNVNFEEAAADCSVAIMPNGTRLYAHGSIQDSATSSNEVSIWESDDDGASWAEIGGTYPFGGETGNERFNNYAVAPAATGDDNDLAVFEHRAGGNTLEIHMYDESGDAWSTPVVLENDSQAWPTYSQKWSFVPRRSDGVLLYCWLTFVGDGAATIETGEVAVTSVTVPVKTNRADVIVFGAAEGQAYASISLNGQNDDVRIGYQRSDRLYTKLSTDDMVTWGAENDVINVDSTVAHGPYLPRYLGDSGGWIDHVWFDDTNNDLRMNSSESIQIASAATTGDSAVTLPSLSTSGSATMSTKVAELGSWYEVEGTLGSNPTASVAKPTSGDDLALVVYIFWEHTSATPRLLSDLTYGGQSGTEQEVHHQGIAQIRGLKLWSFTAAQIAAATGSPPAYGFTWDGGDTVPDNYVRLASRFFANVDPSVWRGTDGNNGQFDPPTGTQWAASVAHQDGDMGVAAGMGQFSSPNDATPASIDQGYSEDFDVYNSDDNIAGGVVAFTGPGSTQPTVTWTDSGQAAGPGASAGGVLRVVAGGGAGGGGLRSAGRGLFRGVMRGAL
ncbi:MAG TPA: hypothetical protein VFH61_06515 [Thermoleophilia bacterium]|nr:hypothetical protein [Thermoleophilia bacterium]